MKKTLLSILPALFAIGVSAATPKSDSPAGITVISYNIRYADAEDGTNSWTYRYYASALMFLEQKPDVLGVQEALYPQVMYMAEVASKDYKWIGVGRDNGKKEGEYTAIYYNKKRLSLLKSGWFWLSETPDKPSIGWEAACKRTATWAILKHKESGKSFMVVNTHLDHVSPEARIKGLELISAKVAEINTDKLPLVVMGDFNMPPSEEGIANFSKKMNNARVYAKKSDNLGSLHNWGKTSAPIDYIFYKDFRECSSYETHTKAYGERKFISDHYPVKAELIF